MAAGAEIHLSLPSATKELDSREIEYLAGREVPELPGLALRQNSVGAGTVTVFGTATITVTTTATAPLPVSVVTPFPRASGQASNLPGQGAVTTFFENNDTQAAPTRPWMVTASETGRYQASYLGLLLWAAGLLVLDYVHGY